MAKTKAEITFTADTSEFSEGIKKANSSMTELRSELKLVNAQMANSGTSVDGLEQKERILSEMQEQMAAKVDALNGKYLKAVEIWGKNSIEAQKYATQLNSAKTAQEKLKGDVSKCSAELQEARSKMEGAETSARGLADGLDKAAREANDLNTSIGDIAAGNMLADFASNAVSSLASLDEATQEHRVSMAQLETAYAHSNRAVEEAHDVYEGFLGIVGDSDQATEAALDMRNLADAGADAAMWYDIASGAATAHGDALPIENLIESANETVRCGQVVGGLADALNWTTINQDEFNAKMSEYPGIMAAYNQAVSEGLSNEDAMNAALAECGTEQERVALLTAALGTQYSEMGEQFQETNEAVAESRVASDELLQSQSKLADKIAPLATLVKSLAADGLGLLADNLNWVIPILGIAAGAFGALWLAANGGAMLATLRTSISGIGMAIGAINTPILIAIAAITAITGVIVYLWNTNEGFRNAVTLAWEGIKTAIASVCEALAPIVQPAFEQIQSIVDSIMNGSVAPIISGALTVISGLFQTVCGAIVAITTGDFTTLSSGVQSILSGLKSIVSGIFDGIKSAVTSKINGAKDAVSNAINSIKSAFNFSWSLPKLKLPHVSITGSFSLMPPRTPRFSVSWYAKAMDKAMILSNPTIFGMMGGNALGAGEAGREVVSGESHLMGLIGTVVQNAMPNDGTDRIVAAVEKLADRVTVLELNGRVLATATAGDMDSVNGNRQMLVGRGLTL